MVLCMNEEVNSMNALPNGVVTGDILAVSGDHGRAVSGEGGRSFASRGGCAISGNRGCSSTGDDGYSLSGDNGLSASGARGTSISGVGGAVCAGVGGVLVLNNVDQYGNSFVVAADIDEDLGPRPNVYYKLDGHTFVLAFSVGDATFDTGEAA